MRKITRSRFIWLLCGGASIAAVSVAAAPMSARLFADDVQVCRKESGNTAIAACSRAIASGSFQDRALARILSDRAFEYRRKGEADRAMTDYNAAIRVDPQYVHAFIGRGSAWQDRH